MKVPEGWEDISIRQYQVIREELKDYKDNQESRLMVLAALTDQSIDDIKKQTLTDLSKAISNLGWVNALPHEKKFLSFKLKGYRFQCRYKISEFTAKEYIDLTGYCKDVEGNLHKILATVCKQRRTLVRRSMLSHKDKQELFFQELPISVAYPISVFFSELSKGFLKATLDFLKEKATAYLTTLKSDGDGS